MIAFACRQCHKQYKLKDELAGKRILCPACKQPQDLPRVTPQEAATIPPSLSGPDSEDPTLPPVGAVAAADATVGWDGGDPSSVRLGGSASQQRYEVEAEIARGGMGAIMRANDRDIDREVAIKYLLNQADPRQKTRFIAEAKITGQLEHPNIVPIHDLGLDGEGRMYFSMKMVKGRSLAEILHDLDSDGQKNAKEYTLGRLLTIFSNVCNALGYAHSRNVIHRDLKPANIMIGDFGEVYVMDWGVAKVLTSRERQRPEEKTHIQSNAALTQSGGMVKTNRTQAADLTQDGAIMGTPAYMPPEQARGEIDAIDQRSDIYSLGAILYEILTLTPPVGRGGDAMAVLMRVVDGAIDPPQQRAPKRWIPSELSAIAMKALAMAPADRYQTVEELQRDVQLYQEGRSVSAKHDTAWESFQKLVKRNKGASAGVALALVVLLVSLIFLFGSWQKTRAALAEKGTAMAEIETRTQQAVPALIEAARMGVERRNFKNALEQVDLALLYAPDHAAARLLKAQVLIVEGEFASAQSDLDHYLRLKPEDTDAGKLRELCGKDKPTEVVNIIAFSQVFERQGIPSLSIGLLSRHSEVIEARRQLLIPYRKQIEAAWPGNGQRLTLDITGQFIMSSPPVNKISNLAPLEGIPLSKFHLNNAKELKNLSPLIGMPLTEIDLQGSGVLDLTPLKGMQLTRLNLSAYGNQQSIVKIDELSPLEGMLLQWLNIDHTHVQDLTPLKGMPLESLSLANTPVQDLSPLKGMPLVVLYLGSTKVTDISSLKGMPLTKLTLPEGVFDLSPLQGTRLKSLHVRGSRALKDLSALRGMALTDLRLWRCTQVKDLTPLQGMLLVTLELEGTGVTDLTPLKGMPLVTLLLYQTKIQDLTPLKGMPLTELDIDAPNVNDLTPLEGMLLKSIVLSPKNITKGMDVLRKMKGLETIRTRRVGNLSPEEFWKRYDAGEFK